ncbi:MAG: DUF177 domain-containing protein [bacterium]
MHPLDLDFRFDQLPAEGRPFQGALDEAVVAESVEGLLGELGYRATGALAVQGTAWPARRDVVVHATFRVTLGFDCVRCLASRELVVERTVQHVLVREVPGSAPGDAGIEVTDADDDSDEYTFDGEHVKLGEVFREDLLLELPMNPSCEDAGAGICEAAPQPEEARVDLRWAPLAALKAKLENPDS